MRVLLEFGCFCLLFIEFNAGLIRIRILFEGGSLSRIYGNQFSKMPAGHYVFWLIEKSE